MRIFYCCIICFLATSVCANSYKAVKAYKEGDYLLAQQLWSKGDTSDDFYNLGNTLVALGKYKEAINSYDRALKLDNKNTDALYNKNLVLKFLEKNKSTKDKKDNKDNKTQDQNSQKDSKKKEKNKQEKRTQDTKLKANIQKLMPEHEQRQKELMKIIPDDPGGLLKQQFLQEHLKRTSS